MKLVYVTTLLGACVSGAPTQDNDAQSPEGKSLIVQDLHVKNDEQFLDSTFEDPGKEEKCDSGFCLSTNEACMVRIPGGSSSEMVETFNMTYNTIGCAERCEQNEMCLSWTWWGNENICEIFSDCKSKVRGCVDCQTGPRSCGLWSSTEVMLTGGLGLSTVSRPNLDNVTIVGQNSTLDTSISLPRHRWGHVSAFIGYSLYICGGSTELDGNLAPNDTCDIFDASSRHGSWETGPALLTPRHAAAAVELFGRIFVLGGVGFDGKPLETTEVLEPNKNRWEEFATLPMGPLAGLCAVAVKDGIFVAGGEAEGAAVTASAAFYNLTTNSWQHLPSMTVPRGYHSCAINRKTGIDGRDVEIIVTGGMSNMDPENEDFNLVPISSVEIFNMRNLSWRMGVPLPATRAYHTMSTNREHVRIFGGVVSEAMSDEILEYTEDNSWRSLDFKLRIAARSFSATLYPSDLIKKLN